MAFLIENYAGNFPVWLAPVQAVVIPIADRHAEYANRVADELRGAGLRVEVDLRTERMNAKVRDAQLQKVPYMLVVGDDEAARAIRWHCACGPTRTSARCRWPSSSPSPDDRTRVAARTCGRSRSRRNLRTRAEQSYFGKGDTG